MGRRGAGSWLSRREEQDDLIDLTSVVRAGVPHARRLRLRTNLEIYWDCLRWPTRGERADGRPGIAPRPRRSCAIAASRRPTANATFPEVPRYGEIANIAPRWRDLIGYYTRFGDVRELLRDRRPLRHHERR